MNKNISSYLAYMQRTYILLFIQYRMDIEYLLVFLCNSCHNSSLPGKALYMILLC